jgi:starch-binding outer membrane protein, SusD/RagB family
MIKMKNKLNKTKVLAWIIPVLFLVTACELDTKVDIYPTKEMLDSKYGTVLSYGGTAYNYFNNDNGFKDIDGNLFAGVSDEAQHVNTLSNSQKFNEGNYNQYNPLDNRFEYYYTGIRYANICIDETEGYAEMLAKNRTLILDEDYEAYVRDTFNVYSQRNEMLMIEAYCYFELVKRYGGVPIVPAYIENAEDANLPRATAEEVFDKIESNINASLPKLVPDWLEYANRVNGDPIGRFDQKVAMAFKSRALLYAASPLFSEPSQEKWDKAARAAKDIIDAGWFSFHDNYRNLFLGTNAYTSSEVILVNRTGGDNSLEKANYPIATPGGETGLSPSHNLFEAYEEGDPRRDATFVKNGDSWNGRTMEIFAGGKDDPANDFASRTGYYLKKFMNDNLDLQKNQTVKRDWIRFRYAEIVLNFAEAMNEAHGPSDDNGYGLSATDALNMVRTRAAVGLPALDGLSQSQLRDAIKHERRVELAFEDHRYWDLRRWEDAEAVLSQPIMGVVIGSDNVTPSVVKVTDRTFVSKMNLYPIPQNAIIRSDNVLTQNPGW